MAVLLVAMSVMAISLTIAMPVWKQMAQREKEAELIFRGQQYVHAIGLFQRKFANATPPNLDVLVEQHFLRKKYKDPITNDDFVPIVAGQATPGQGGPGTSGSQPGGQGTTPNSGRPGASPSSGGSGFQSPTFNASTGVGSSAPATAGGGGSPIGGTSPIGTPGAGGRGGIIGVQSKSKDKSIRIYNGRSHYNEWAFVYTAQITAPGGGARGTTAPGQRGQPGQSTNPFGGPGGQRGPNSPAPTNPFGPGSFGSPSPGTPGRGFGSPFQPTTPTTPRGGSGG
jgi:type II secretory pathway pseudopilin PulG